jgi:hypothetical protein
VTRRIDGDCWEGRACDHWEVADATFADVERALERLDAKTWTLMTIGGPDELHLGIGGGGGQYVIYAGSAGEEELWDLVSAQPRDGVVMLTIGGQEGDYPARQIVDLEQARTAARTFFLTGALDLSLRWEQQ